MGPQSGGAGLFIACLPSANNCVRRNNVVGVDVWRLMKFSSSFRRRHIRAPVKF